MQCGAAALHMEPDIVLLFDVQVLGQGCGRLTASEKGWNNLAGATGLLFGSTIYLDMLEGR